MKARWIRLARRLNSLSVRERVIMAVSLAAALAAVVDALVLSPQFAAQRALVDRMRSQGAELTRMRSQLPVPGAGTPQSSLQRELAGQRAELATVDAAIAERLGAGQAASLPELLQRVLRRHERLALLKLDTVPPKADDAAARRSVEIQLAGRYADLADYAAAIERQLPGLRWARLDIDAGPQPPVMTARVWLPGGAP